MRSFTLAGMGAIALLVACGEEVAHGGRDTATGGAGGASGTGGAAGSDAFDQGTSVSVNLSEGDQAVLGALDARLAEVADKTAEEIAVETALPFTQNLGYDPTQAAGMDLIQGSALALDSAELATLADRGFVISDRGRFPNFVYGYELIYATDLPLYVSADSILHAVHQSYDSLLRNIELEQLIPSLRLLLQGMRARLPTLDLVGLDARARADIDFYLTVAASLLAGQVQAPVAGADRSEVYEYLSDIAAEQGMVERQLFGVNRVFDFSQFTVRGHYTQDENLKQYFRAMMWLGRIDFRLLETQAGGEQVFRRRQLEAALALRELIDAAARPHWGVIDRTLSAFTGVQDSMSLPELDRLLGDLGVTELDELGALEDQAIAQAIVDGGYGKQQISSHIMLRPPGDGTFPLNRSFLLFGQRYVVDSHVFSHVVWDRIPYEAPAPARGLPDPLDAAYAALGNDHAVALLAEQLSTFEYASGLAAMRILVDEHPAEYWEANLYNLWLGSLRALSPGTWVADPVAAGLPVVAGTEAWGRRILNTQLASWSELRHDTLLYAKQSYTAGQSICEYPDAYVDPYPEFFAALVRFAEHGQSLVAEIGLPLDGRVAAYFAALRSTASILGEMASAQRSGAPHSAEHIAFINRAVRTHAGGGGCGSPESSVDAEGWYADLFLEAADRVAFDPNIADVHTQPTTVPPAPSAPVGYILHVGTGMARPIVVTTNSCTGPRAYVGLASSYFERVTEGFDRLTDERWAAEITTGSPADVPWMQDLVGR